MSPDRGMELELETGDSRMQRSRPVKRLSDGELAELRTQLINLLDRGSIQHSTAGHAAALVFARNPDGTWHICYDDRGLNAITRPALEPLSRIDALLAGTRGSCFFTELDLASSYHQLRVRAADRWKTSFRSQAGPVRVERGAVRSGRGLVAAGAGYESGLDRWPRLSCK